MYWLSLNNVARAEKLFWLLNTVLWFWCVFEVRTKMCGQERADKNIKSEIEIKLRSVLLP